MKVRFKRWLASKVNVPHSMLQVKTGVLTAQPTAKMLIWGLMERVGTLDVISCKNKGPLWWPHMEYGCIHTEAMNDTGNHWSQWLDLVISYQSLTWVMNGSCKFIYIKRYYERKRMVEVNGCDGKWALLMKKFGPLPLDSRILTFFYQKSA